jgi:hypothetical protein
MSERTTQEVFEDHLHQRKIGDLEADIARNYACPACHTLIHYVWQWFVGADLSYPFRRGRDKPALRNLR